MSPKKKKKTVWERETTKQEGEKGNKNEKQDEKKELENKAFHLHEEA